MLDGVAANVSLMWSLMYWLDPLATNLAFSGPEVSSMSSTEVEEGQGRMTHRVLDDVPVLLGCN